MNVEDTTKDCVIQVRVDGVTKKFLDDVSQELGRTTSELVRMMIYESVWTQTKHIIKQQHKQEAKLKRGHLRHDVKEAVKKSFK